MSTTRAAPSRAVPIPRQEIAHPRSGHYLNQGGNEAVVGAVVALGAAAVTYMWWRDTAPSAVSGAGAFLTSAGRVTGLLGTYLVVVEVLLMARAPWLDRLIGMDRLAVWHRRNGEYSICLLVAHAFLTIWGYALTTHAGLVRETKQVVLDLPDMLAATVGLGLLVAVGALSARAVKRHVSYHTWYFVHLYTYIALALSFAHQFNTGVDFARHPLNRLAWGLMYGFVAAVLVAYRVVKPLLNASRHQFSVVGTITEAPGVTSVYVAGQDLDHLRVEPGQFFLWRFLTRQGWWQAHPFSLSAAPNGRWLRMTAKSSGDYSSTLDQLRPGTRAVLEGPYGNFTARKRRRRRVLFLCGGAGVGPVRALAEAMPARQGDLTLLYRASGESDLALRAELEELAEHKGIRLHYLLGSREDNPHYLAPSYLARLAPNAARSDVFICGPPGFTDAACASLRALGVPRAQLHIEAFEL